MAGGGAAVSHGMGLTRGYVVALLFAISLFNYLDRWSVAGIINDLQGPPAQGGFGLSDAQGGLVTSTFIASYMAMSPLFGYYGDRMPRIPLLFIGIVGWSLAVLFSSFATFYWQFLAFRAMCGVGESAFAILAPSIIADLYTGTERTRILGLYCSSIPLGSAMGYVYAGEVARILSWRWVFRLTPFVGLILACVLLCFVHEPVRGDSDGCAVTPTPNSVKQTERASGLMGFIRDIADIVRVRSFFFSTLGAVGVTASAGMLGQWATALLQRINCKPTDASCESDITRTFGIITMITGVGGSITGAAAARAYARVNPAAEAIVSAVSLLLAAPFVFAAIFYAPTHYFLTFFCIFVGEFLVSALWPLLTTIQLSVVPPSQRSTANSISLLVMHLFGDASSPVLVGVIADHLHNKGKGLSRAVSLQQALYLTVITTVVGGLFFIAAAPHLQQDRVQALSADDSGYREVSLTERDRDDNLPSNASANACLDTQTAQPLQSHSTKE